MKNFVRLLLSCFSLAASCDAFAGDGYDFYSGVSLVSVRTTQNGVKNTSAGLTGILSPRYTGKHYGFELQGGYFGRGGQFTPNIEIDLSVIGLLPLGGSGINLYAKTGLADFITRTSSNNAELTYGAGVEYLRSKVLFRLGWQHFKMGGKTLSASNSTNVVGVAVLFGQE